MRTYSEKSLKLIMRMRDTLIMKNYCKKKNYGIFFV